MQVSWIDPEEVRALLRQIEGPRRGENSSAWEVHTLPPPSQTEEPGEPLISEAGTAPEMAAADDTPLGDARGGPANAEIWRIRERLRVLRDKAQTAGILSLPTAEPPAQEPLPAPVPEAPREDPVAMDAEEPASEEEPQMEASPPPVAPAPNAPAAMDTAPADLQPPALEYEPLFSASSPAAPPDAAPPDDRDALETAPAKPPFVVPNLGLSERLNEVATWASRRLGTHEVLLVDDYGDVLWGAQGQTALVLSAMMAWHSAQRSSATATCTDPQRIDKPLGPDRALTVLPMRTRYGVVSLAAIQPQPVAEEDAAAIREALALAVEGPVDNRSQPGV